MSVPPLTSMISPVMKEASGEARNNTAAATSSDVPILPRGTRGVIMSFFPSSVPSGAIDPGATAFTVISCGASSKAKDLVRLIIPALDAQ